MIFAAGSVVTIAMGICPQDDGVVRLLGCVFMRVGRPTPLSEGRSRAGRVAALDAREV
jgi:hypothetical protein